MAEYLSPGVYVESVQSASLSIDAASSSIGVLIGTAQCGPVGVPVLINSWQSYVRNFANGMTSPFLSNSDLAYAVYGFFQNGGSNVYVIRVAHSALNEEDNTEAYAVAALANASTMVVNAKSAGTWANNMSLVVTANADETGTFDVVVKLGEEVVETFTAMSNDATSESYWVDYIASVSEFITPVSGTLSAVTSSFSGGKDGMTSVVDTDYISVLDQIDLLDDATLIAIPGQTSTTITQALLSYQEKNSSVFPILDAPKASTVESVRALRKTLSGNAALPFPWIRVTDPLSKVGKLRDCPTAGHVMGVYARIIESRGCWKSPAGTEAVVRGAIETVVSLTKADTDLLNPLGIIPIMVRQNYGICIWGARTLSKDSSMRYVSDILLDILVKKSIYKGTQGFVFEPHDSTLWTRVTATCEAFLNNLWTDGAFFGDSAGEAYYVKCDADLNPESSRNAGRLICEIGYAQKKPAEFVIFRVAHEVNS